jgi:hypothetical protein
MLGLAMRMFSGCMFAALLAATPAKADEVWKTDLGEIMWETDYDEGAIFRIDTAKGKFLRFYIEGLEPTSAPRGHVGATRPCRRVLNQHQ